MYKTEKLFFPKISDNKIDYINSYKECTDIWEEDFENKSLMSQIIINMFSEKTIFHNNEMLDIARYLQVYFRLFQCLP